MMSNHGFFLLFLAPLMMMNGLTLGADSDSLANSQVEAGLTMDKETATTGFLRDVVAVPGQDERRLGGIGECGYDCNSNDDCLWPYVCWQRFSASDPLPPCCSGTKPNDDSDFCVPATCGSTTVTPRPSPSPTPLPTSGPPVVTPSPTTAAPVAPTPSPAPTKPPVTVVACFSGSTMVDVLNKGMIPMEKLVVGDMIRTSKQYQTVYSFGHYHPTQQAEFLVLHTNDNKALEVTSDHLVYLEGKTNPIRAKSVQMGDRLQPFGATVTEIGRVTKMGIYAPLTSGGNLMVNGNILVSSYSSLVQDTDEYAVFNNGRPFMAQHSLIHMVLTPFRMMCRATSASMCQSYDHDGMPHYVTKWIKFLTWLNANCSTMVQVVVFALAFFFLGTLMLTESLVFGEPFLVLAIIYAGKAWYNKEKTSKMN